MVLKCVLCSALAFVSAAYSGRFSSHVPAGQCSGPCPTQSKESLTLVQRHASALTSMDKAKHSNVLQQKLEMAMKDTAMKRVEDKHKAMREKHGSDEKFRCASPEVQELLALKHANSTGGGPACATTILTSFFTGMPDWQREGVHHNATIEYMQRFYDSIALFNSGDAAAIKVVVANDQLPLELTERCTTDDGAFSFHKANLSAYDALLGCNDVRFLLYRDLIRAHPEWDTIFMTDLSDVQVKQNPCIMMGSDRNKLFVGKHQKAFRNPWMADRYGDMGGKYERWYHSFNASSFFNAGVVGGARGVVLNFLDRLASVLMDPELAVRRQDFRDTHKVVDKTPVNVNMGALNYVLFSNYTDDDVIAGFPVTSVFGENQESRTDVMFVHKL